MVEHARPRLLVGPCRQPGGRYGEPVANPWLERRVLHFAHQGGALEAPSSTMFAFRRAVELGADALELDVHATADGHLVVGHDATVDATTGSSGPIAALTLAQLRELDNAFHFDEERGAPYRGRAPADPAFGVATLREVLEAFPATFLNMDIKQSAPEVVPYEVALAELLAEFGRADDVIVGSFLDATTEAFSAAAPEVHTAAGLMATAAFWQALRDGTEPPPSRHVALQVPPAMGGMTVVDEAFVAGAHAHGLAVHVWTIDEAAEMNRLIDLGVDGVMTDRPSVLAAVLAERGVGWTARPG